jgi:predicted RNase H-like HicB family nuclease
VRQIKIMVEKHADGYVAYPLGLKGVVVGEGDTYEEVLADVESAIKIHLEAFGEEAFDVEDIIEDLWLGSQCDDIPQ